jgi:TatD DNase family protein
VAVGSAQENEGVFASVGRHPNSADGFDAAAAEAIEALCAIPEVVAVGETGLDFYRDRSDPDEQRRAFSAQIAIAARTGKALVIHLRDADGSEDAVSEAFETLGREGRGVTVVLHCFSAGAPWAERAAERGWYCSFAGTLTYPKADAIREAASVVPDERLLVETDSPFLAPQPVRGKPNQPANVVATAERLAEVRGVPYGELERTVEANAARVFGW